MIKIIFWDYDALQFLWYYRLKFFKSQLLFSIYHIYQSSIYSFSSSIFYCILTVINANVTKRQQFNLKTIVGIWRIMHGRIPCVCACVIYFSLCNIVICHPLSILYAPCAYNVLWGFEAECVFLTSILNWSACSQVRKKFGLQFLFFGNRYASGSVMILCMLQDLIFILLLYFSIDYFMNWKN